MTGTPELPRSVFTTIIVPTCDRPDALARCLSALCAQKSGAPFHVIISDDGRLSPAHPVVARFKQRLDVTVVQTPSPRSGAAKARNVAISRVRGDFTGFLDDDAVPASDWVATGIAFLQSYESIEAVVGYIRCLHPDRFLAQARQEIYDERDRHYRSPETQDRLRASIEKIIPDSLFVCDYLSGGNFFSRSGLWTRGLRFPEETLWGHDRVVSQRIQAGGGIVAYHPELTIHHEHEHRFFRCLTKGYQHGYYSELSKGKMAADLSIRQAFKPALRQAFGQNVEGIPRANTRVQLPKRLVLAVLTGAYQLGRYRGAQKCISTRY